MAVRLCPVWVGYVLASPVRKLIWENPDKILKPYVNEAMPTRKNGFMEFSAPDYPLDADLYSGDMKEETMQS